MCKHYTWGELSKAARSKLRAYVCSCTLSADQSYTHAHSSLITSSRGLGARKTLQMKAQTGSSGGFFSLSEFIYPGVSHEKFKTALCKLLLGIGDDVAYGEKIPSLRHTRTHTDVG